MMHILDVINRRFIIEKEKYRVLILLKNSHRLNLISVFYDSSNNSFR